MQPLLTLDAVEKHFIHKSLLGKPKVVRAVDGVSLQVEKGATLGIVGESGCGKSTLANLIIRLEEPSGGRILLEETDISHLTEKQLRAVRSRVQIIFQDPYSSLNPRFTVEQIVSEPMRVAGKWSRTEIRRKVIFLLEKVGLSEDYLKRYPHEFSGGQRQRISIARALTTDPEILILDEPTSALDVSVQAQVLNLLLKLQKELGLTYIFISHNLSVVKYISNRVAVMYLGKIVEAGSAEDIMFDPRHPYTQELVAAVPVIGKPLDSEELACREAKSAIVGRQGCRYYLRCRLATTACRETEPELKEYEAGRCVACMEVRA
ncbi:Oligopeptide transport ATP-binding protein AppF [Propionispora sp. 2/2-37]|uniref:ABC transporter ATP-binding protein n=1 Tax=Propionispora sp. 2/2-37 TaxID=1677858 RepID=UPI0006BB6178|nr:oligopeptide/dipeptide ABC transporter ATP-binding protein [Propionispora sp. 2/2-37]CUH95811.1 Oligopeptide transport ATP-binding protein AppF [Propionispora sp. 2/2-37]